MTEAEWLECEEPKPMIELLRTHPRIGPGKFTSPVGRRLRLFSVGCCRHVERGLIDPRSLQAIATFERYLDGEATDAEWQEALDAADLAKESRLKDWQYIATSGVYSTIFDDVDDEWKNAQSSAWDAVRAARGEACEVQYDGNAYSNAQQTEQKYQAALLRDIFGNPFRPITFSPSWRTDTAVSLARQMYDRRDFSAMPILADALQDAGCDSEDILSHCRGDGPHVRGCWVVDLILGKE
jgi:hypothetical protein